MFGLVTLDKDQDKFISTISDQTGLPRKAVVGLLIEAGVNALVDPDLLRVQLSAACLPADTTNHLRTIADLLIKWKNDGTIKPVTE